MLVPRSACKVSVPGTIFCLSMVSAISCSASSAASRAMVEDRRTLGPTESIEEAERLFIEDFDTWDMTGYYLYSKFLRSCVSAHIGTWGPWTGSIGARSSC